MIGLETIRDNIQTTLNANQFGKVFRLYTNDGEFRKAFRDGNDITEYINGICRVSNSSLTPLKSLSILTMSVEVEFCIRVDNLEKDANGNYIEVLNIQALCENFVNSQNGQTITLTEDNKTYVLAVNTEMPIVGVERLVTPLGKCLPITLQIFYTMVENGVNSSNVSLYIGGEEVPYTDLTIDRVFVNTVAQKATEEVGKTINEQNSVSISFVAPLTTTALGNDYTDIILDGGNNIALPVTIDYKSLNKKANYTMTFSSLKHTSSGVQNVGVQGTLVEVDTNVADFKTLNIGKWSHQNITINKQYADQYAVVQIINDANYYIDWGDDINESGKTPSTGEPTIAHNYTSDGDFVISLFTNPQIYPFFSLENELILPQDNDDFSITAKIGNKQYYSGDYIDWQLGTPAPQLTITVNFNEGASYRIDSLMVNGVEITNGQSVEITTGIRVDLIYSKSVSSRTTFPNSKPQTVQYALGKELVDNTALLSLKLKDNVEIASIYTYMDLTNEYQNVTVTTAVGGSQTLNTKISNTTLQILDDSTLSPNVEEYYIETNYWSQKFAQGEV